MDRSFDATGFQLAYETIRYAIAPLYFAERLRQIAPSLFPTAQRMTT